jgi:DNA-binding XRE family transcriptional regulator
MNRTNHFVRQFILKGYNVEDIAKELNIHTNSLYKKMNGRNGFSEKDCKKIMELLDMKFEEIFI